MKTEKKAGCTLLYFAFHGYFANVFAEHITKYETLTIHFLHFMRISCFINAEFHVLFMSWKNKPRNPSTFRANANPGVKCYEMQKAKKEARNTKKVMQNTPSTIHFSFFAFHDCFCVFCGTCIPGLKLGISCHFFFTFRTPIFTFVQKVGGFCSLFYSGVIKTQVWNVKVYSEYFVFRSIFCKSIHKIPAKYEKCMAGLNEYCVDFFSQNSIFFTKKWFCHCSQTGANFL